MIRNKARKIICASCAALILMTGMFAGCQKSDTTVSNASEKGQPSATEESVPETFAQIAAHNDKINPDDIKLIQFDAPQPETKTAIVKTSQGDIKIALYPSEAPKAVENFIALVEKGYYNNQCIYEIIPEIRVSMGSPDPAGNPGESASGEDFADEYSLNLWHFNGAVAMNNGGAKGNNESRFYIVQNDEQPIEYLGKVADAGFPQKVVDKYVEIGGLPSMDHKDTVFGQVTEGLDVVRKIAQSERGTDNKPKTPILIESITIA